MTKRSLLRILLGIFCFTTGMLSMGCGTGPAPKLVPVTGTLELDGKPVSGASVFFNPMTKTHGLGAFAVTDESGNFELMHFSRKPGCEEGQYGVTFSKVTQPDGSPIPQGKTPAGVATVQQIPKIYVAFDPRRPVEVANVIAGSSSLDFKLSSKKKGAGRKVRRKSNVLLGHGNQFG